MNFCNKLYNHFTYLWWAEGSQFVHGEHRAETKQGVIEKI